MAAKSTAAVPITSASSRRRRRAGAIGTAAASGSARELLVAMRDRIAREIDDGVPARELASLTRRLLEISRDIEALDQAGKGDGVADAAATPDEPWSE